MGWMAPSRHLSAKMVVVEDQQERKPSMGEISTIGIDVATHVFPLHGVDAVRDLLVWQRTMLVNAMRGDLAESGIVAPRGIHKAFPMNWWLIRRGVKEAM